MGIINRVGGMGNLHGSLDIQVSADADDWNWDTDAESFSDDDYLSLGWVGTVHLSAMFRGINIPAGAVISTAYIQLYLDEGDGTVSGCRVYFNKSATPTVATTYSQANGKTTTTAYATWNVPATGTWLNSPDIKTVIQELIDSYGAYSNGNMLFILKAYSDANYVDMRSYNNGDGSYAPKLHIEW